MQVRVLGSLEVLTDAGEAVGLGGATQRRLLAVLVIDAGSVVSADRLCDVLDVSEGGLRTTVSRLRRAIGDTHLVTEPPGYRLAAEDVDAARFEGLFRVARASTPVDSAETLGQALGLWRGLAYAEFADEDWARPEAVRLNELRAVAVEDRAEALLAVGRFTEAAASLEHHRAEHPLRDRPCGLAMRALAAQGSPSRSAARLPGPLPLPRRRARHPTIGRTDRARTAHRQRVARRRIRPQHGPGPHEPAHPLDELRGPSR